MAEQHPGNSTYARIARCVDPQFQLIHAIPLNGGVSAEVILFECLQPDGRLQKLVVRQHGAADRAANPRIAATEYTLLHMLHSAGLPVPQPLYLDESLTILPEPYIVITYLAGSIELAPADVSGCVRQLAAQLAAIHALDCTRYDFSFLPHATQRLAARLEQPGTEHIRATLSAATPVPQRNPTTLLHGDFWLGNILWRYGTLSGVINWEDAACGDPLADVSNARLEILWSLGKAAMYRFTRDYLALAQIDTAALPYWDLYAALRLGGNLSGWVPDGARRATMQRRLDRFVAEALAALPPAM